MRLYTPSHFHGQIPYGFLNFNRLEINTMTASNIKTCDQTKVWVLNLNFASKIAYDRTLNNFQNEAVN